jgi:hypothetical protein
MRQHRTSHGMAMGTPMPERLRLKVIARQDELWDWALLRTLTARPIGEQVLEGARPEEYPFVVDLLATLYEWNTGGRA